MQDVTPWGNLVLHCLCHNGVSDESLMSIVYSSDMWECTAAPPETKAQDADRAALAGTGLEGLFDPAPAGVASPAPLAGALVMRHFRIVHVLKGIVEISGACVCVISPC